MRCRSCHPDNRPPRRQRANASETKPAMLLAVFVVDANETELTIPFGTEVLAASERNVRSGGFDTYQLRDGNNETGTRRKVTMNRVTGVAGLGPSSQTRWRTNHERVRVSVSRRRSRKIAREDAADDAKMDGVVEGARGEGPHQGPGPTARADG